MRLSGSLGKRAIFATNSNGRNTHHMTNFMRKRYLGAEFGAQGGDVRNQP